METKTLFTTRYGSHLYGTNTETSDQDFKSVVLVPIGVLLRGVSVKNSVKSTGQDNSKNTPDDVDEEFIPLQVFARDFFEGQTYALEMAFALVNNNENVTVYDPMVVEFTNELVDNFLTRNVSSMVGFAFSQAHKYGVKGRRLESIEQFDQILRLHISLHGVNVRLSSVSDDVERHKTKYLYNSEYDVGGYNQGMMPCVKIVDKVFPYALKITEAHDRVKALLKQYGSRSKEAKDMGGYDWKALSHAVRISGSAVGLLKHGTIHNPVNEDEKILLLNIKSGRLSWDEVEAVINERLESIDALLTTTVLPEKTHEMDSDFMSFLDGWLLKFYGLKNK